MNNDDLAWQERATCKCEHILREHSLGGPCEIDDCECAAFTRGRDRE